MVPGMISELTNINFIDKCIELNISGNSVEASREIDGGKENISTSLPLIIGGQKGLVEENDLRIPNMRGIMMARKKELMVIEANKYSETLQTNSFEKPKAKGEVTLVSSDEVEKLIELLHNEAKAL
jgi:electron transfer flavoprotein beta subunit